MSGLSCNAYTGDEKYGFISYAHADDRLVLPVIQGLYERKYRLWYDKGIEVGARWTQTVAVRERDSDLVILFLSKAYIKSLNCMNEMNYAVSQKRGIVCVLLDDSPLSPEMALQLAAAPRLNAAGCAPAEIAAMILETGKLNDSFLGDGVEGYGADGGRKKRKLNPWMIVSAVTAFLLVAAVALGYGYTRGLFGGGVSVSTQTVPAESGGTDEVTVTSWGDDLLRDVMLQAVSSESVYLCGNAVISSPDAIRFSDGQWFAGETAVENGGIDDFSALSGKSLKQLALAYQALGDISGITEFPELEYLDLSGNDISDLAPLAQLGQLRVLKIEHIPASDLSSLKNCPSLRFVYVSEDMLPRVHDMLDASFDVVVKN